MRYLGCLFPKFKKENFLSRDTAGSKIPNPGIANRSFNRISRIPIARIFGVLRSGFPGFKFTNLGHQQSSVLGFFRNRDFYFGIDRNIPKIPKSRGSGSGLENPEKMPSEKSRKSRRSGSGFENLEKIPSTKSQKCKIPGIPDFFGIF